jgi:hypothetical protein
MQGNADMPLASEAALKVWRNEYVSIKQVTHCILNNNNTGTFDMPALLLECIKQEKWFVMPMLCSGGVNEIQRKNDMHLPSTMRKYILLVL